MPRRPDQPSETRLNVILFLLALWIAAWLVSLWAYLVRSAPSSGLDNESMALGWQGVAAILALAIWGVGWGLPRGNGVRRMSLGPVALGAMALVAWLLGLV